MAVTHKTGEVEHAGRVLAVWYGSEQIMSDMWESAVHFRYWTGEAVRTTYHYCYEGVTVEVDADAETQGLAAAWESEQAVIREECRRTDAAVRYAYGFRHGQTVRVVAGRKVPVGSVVELTTGEMPSAFDRHGTVCHVRDTAGNVTRYCDTNNFEVVPTTTALGLAGETEMRCPCCKALRPVADYLFSGHAGYGRRRVVRSNDSVQCIRCEAADLSGFVPGTDGHTLAVAVLAGELSAVLPLIDELISDGNEYRADELKRLHKLDKPQRKPRKAKAVAG